MLSQRKQAGVHNVIEPLLAFVIIAIVAAIVVPKFTGKPVSAGIRHKATENDISCIKSALYSFRSDNGRYPTTHEGLQALVANPANLQDWRRYMVKIPVDPWGQRYIYRCPGSDGRDFDLTYLDPTTGAEAPQ
ncbi:MAG TPA: type II secretion system protein GspG [Tepidisphaeraceae bacterium]|nr:type II secretion system protein GspG [Tepidisphaeraceae bacterium]